MSKKSVARKRPRPARPKRAALRAGLRPGPDSFWREGQPPTFTREELAEKRRLVTDLEHECGRQHPAVQLFRAVHALALRQARRHEAWLERQLRTLEPPQ
jgi:hypothetical protein